MDIQIKVTDQKLYDEKVIDVNVTSTTYLTNSFTGEVQGFRGHVSIETTTDEFSKEITGEFNENEYEEEFGFRFILD